MRIHVALVDDADVHRTAVVSRRPRFPGLTAVGVRRRGFVAVHAPEVPEGVVGVVSLRPGRRLRRGGWLAQRLRHVFDDPVRLGELDRGILREVAHGRRDAASWRQRHEVEIALPVVAPLRPDEVLLVLCADAAEGLALGRRIDAGPELHDQLAGDVRCVLVQRRQHQIGSSLRTRSRRHGQRHGQRADHRQQAPAITCLVRVRAAHRGASAVVLGPDWPLANSWELKAGKVNANDENSFSINVMRFFHGPDSAEL